MLRTPANGLLSSTKYSKDQKLSLKTMLRYLFMHLSHLSWIFVMLFCMAYLNQLSIGYNMCKIVRLDWWPEHEAQNTKLRTHNTSSSDTSLATSQTTNYVQNTTPYIQSTEWHGAKVYSRPSSTLHSYEAITIFLKKFASNTEVEPQVLRR